MALRLVFFSLLLLDGGLQEPKDWNRAVERGVWLAQQNRLAEAEKEFDSIPASSPAYWQSRYYSAVAKIQLKKTDAARSILAALIARHPDHKEAHLLLGMLSEDAGKFKEAEAHYRRLTNLSPGDPKGWTGLGRVLSAQGNSEKALQAWEQAVKQSPGDLSLSLMLGGEYYNLGRFHEAIRRLLPAWQAGSKDPGLAVRLATSYAAVKDTANLEGMLQSLPQEMRVDIELAVGVTLTEAGEEGRGFSYLVSAAGARPQDYRTQRILADALFKSQLFEDAQKAYRSCLGIRPDDSEAVFWLGRSYYEDRKIAEAHAEYLRAVSVLPDSPAAWFHLGISNRALQKSSEAREAFLKSLELEPGNAETLYNLGMVALQDQDPAGAVGYFQRAIAGNPQHVGALYELGRHWIIKGEVERGLARIEETIKCNPTHTQAHYQRGMALRRLGRMEEAKQELELFQDLERQDRERRKVISRKILVPKVEP